MKFFLCKISIEIPIYFYRHSERHTLAYYCSQIYQSNFYGLELSTYRMQIPNM